MTDDTPIRDAATVILVRDAGTSPRVLMGQRGRGAIFMPGKFVFPGGAMDAEDADIPLDGVLEPTCRERLLVEGGSARPEQLAAAAIRELWEETGLRLAHPGAWDAPGADWSGFGARPSASSLRFFFRAITPPGRPRRFDARFFLASADAVLDVLDDMQPPTDELSNLSWIPVEDAYRLDLAFITELVIAELLRHLPSLSAPDRVPFVRNDVMDNSVTWI